MAFMEPPSWLQDTKSLNDIIQHHLFLPQHISQLTSLPDSVPFNTGLKRFLFWKGQLAPSLKKGIVFLAFLGPLGLKLPNPINVTHALKNILDLSKIIEFYQGADNHFLALSFSTPDCVDKILNLFKYYDDTVVLAITFNDAPQYRFRLLWLPPLFEVARVHHLLQKYTKSHRLKRESIPIADGGYAPTNVVSGFLTLDAGVNPDSLPHLIQLPSPHKGCALLTIEARPPLCLKCRDIGHTRQKCPMIKCNTCNKVHFPSSPCGTSSYSSVASRNITTSTEGDWLEKIGEDDSSLLLDSSSSNLLNLNTNGNSAPITVHTSSHSIHNKQPASEHFFSSTSVSLDECIRECGHTPDVSTDGPLVLASLSDPAAIQDNSHSIDPSFVNIIQVSNHKIDSPGIVNSSEVDTTALSSVNVIDPTFKLSHNIPVMSAKSTASNLIITKPTFTRTKDSSKVRISDIPISSANSARSQLIEYEVCNISSAAIISPYQPTKQSSASLLFGDPDLSHVFSDSDSPSSPQHLMDTSDLSQLESPHRKRKGPHSLSDSDSLADENADLFPSDLVSSNSLAPQSQDMFKPSLNSTLPMFDPDTGSDLASSSLFKQVSDLFKMDDYFIAHLEGLCPLKTFTPDIVKALQLLASHGFNYHSISKAPKLLKLRLPTIKKKIQQCLDQYGVVHIEHFFSLTDKGRAKIRAPLISP